MEVIIERPILEDLKRINELAKQVHKLHVNWRPDLFLDVDEIISKEYFESMIQNKEIFVAKYENEILGYMIFHIEEKTNPSMRYRKQIVVEVLCVDEKNRGQGIGTFLLNYAKQIGKENNCTDLYITVNKENKRAIEVYEKFGFKVKNIAYSMKIE